MNPTLRIIPSNDAAFAQYVDQLWARHRFTTADELARRLRTVFPRVVVRASEVSGQRHVWYVYRDGIWQSSADTRWWADPRTPQVTVTRDGWIEEANTPARALLGLAASDSMPRFFTDFVAPGALEDATDLFSLVADGHELSATILLRPTSGDVIACDLRAAVEGDRIRGAFRLAGDVAFELPVTPRVAARLECEPVADVLFARYAGEALARMPEPTPDGLALRLRRLYPHARVEADGDRWMVFRDGTGGAEAVDQWWLTGNAAAVHYDGHGRITDANDAARELLGAELVGRHWQDLVTPGTTQQVDAVLRLISEVGWAVSRFRMPTADGNLFEFDSYTEVSGDAFLTVMRPRSTVTDAAPP